MSKQRAVYGSGLRKGREVRVFEDPVSCQKFEGSAVLVDSLDEALGATEYWTVRFLSDGAVCDRWINTENH